MLGRLITALDDCRTHVYLHLDSAAEIAEFREAAYSGTQQSLVWLPRRRTIWGSPEIVEAIIDGLNAGLRDNAEYFVVLSGTDTPLRPITGIYSFIEANLDTSFVAYWRLPTPLWPHGGALRTEAYTYTVFGRRETCLPRGISTSHLNTRGKALNTLLRARSLLHGKRRFPSYAAPVGGEMWLNLSRAAAQYVVDFTLEHADYIRYHKHTQIPDELFIQSILLGTPFAESHAIVNDDLRFIIWSGGDFSHPRPLQAADLPCALRGRDLFARKATVGADPGLETAIRRHLGMQPL